MRRPTPEDLIRCVAKRLAAQPPLDGVLGAVELVLTPQRDAAGTLLRWLHRKRGRLGGAALAQNGEPQARRFAAVHNKPAQRTQPAEPAHLPESDRALLREIGRSLEELKATRYLLAVEWLRLRNAFFP